MVRKGGGLDESATTTMPRFFKAGWKGWGLAKRPKECASKMGEYRNE